MKDERKKYVVINVSKEDIIGVFKNQDNIDEIKERVEKMTDDDMKRLASKLADDYCEQLFWGSLKIIFEEIFLKEN